MDNQRREEQRRNERFHVELGALAVFSPDKLVTPGLAIDISLGGMAFLYYEGEQWPEEHEVLLNLFGEGFYLEQVPLQIVSDFAIRHVQEPLSAQMSQMPYGQGNIRRRGVKFGHLSHTQKVLMEQFIREKISG
ncbi:PilZ domain-containing protein [Thermodesulfobacteriota bacterium]